MNRKEAAMSILNSIEKSAWDLFDAAAIPVKSNLAVAKTVGGLMGINKRRGLQVAGAGIGAMQGEGVFGKAVGAVQSGATSDNVKNLAGNYFGGNVGTQIANAAGIKNPLGRVGAQIAGRMAGKKLTNLASDYVAGTY